MAKRGPKGQKASRIRELYAQGMSIREIAETVGVRPEYARICARQRDERGISDADDRYVMRRFGANNPSDGRAKYHAWKKAMRQAYP